jgi:hypothetical protein
MAEELKDFQSANFIRKITTDLMTPLIRKYLLFYIDFKVILKQF